MTRYLIAIGLVLSLLGSTYLYGFKSGRDALQAKLDQAQLKEQEATIEMTAKLMAAEHARQLAQQSLEDLANAQPVSSDACLPASRVLRLNQQ